MGRTTFIEKGIETPSTSRPKYAALIALLWTRGIIFERQELICSDPLCTHSLLPGNS